MLVISFRYKDECVFVIVYIADVYAVIVYQADDVLDQALGTFGEGADIPVVPPKITREELLKRVDFASIDQTALQVKLSTDAQPTVCLHTINILYDNAIIRYKPLNTFCRHHQSFY